MFRVVSEGCLLMLRSCQTDLTVVLLIYRSLSNLKLLIYVAIQVNCNFEMSCILKSISNKVFYENYNKMVL